MFMQFLQHDYVRFNLVKICDLFDTTNKVLLVHRNLSYSYLTLTKKSEVPKRLSL